MTELERKALKRVFELASEVDALCPDIGGGRFPRRVINDECERMGIKLTDEEVESFIPELLEYRRYC